MFEYLDGNYQRYDEPQNYYGYDSYTYKEGPVMKHYTWKRRL